MAADLNTVPSLYARPAPVPVVLAAGDSARMGIPKALLRLGDGTFLSRILGVLEGLELPPAVVVLGKHAPLILGNFPGRGPCVLINTDPGQGQISSLQLAMRNLDACSGCLVWPVDQPCVRLEVVRGLVERFIRTGASIVMPVCGGRRGHPAIFSADLFGEFLGVPAGSGPKALIAAHEQQISLYETDDRATIEDIDTPEDYVRLVGA